MAAKVTRLRVFVASPGDVREEREALERMCVEINRGIAADLNVTLEVMRWETHVRPGIADDAQQVVNKQLPNEDVFVGIMWRRFGTPTRRAESGTEEEFNRAIKAQGTTGTPEIMMYFNEAPYYPRDNDEILQMSRVLSFRKRIESLGVLYWTYQSSEEFPQLIRNHLELLLRQRYGQAPGGNLLLVSSPGKADLKRFFDSQLVSDESLQPLIAAVPEDTTRLFRRLVLQLELMEATPSFYGPKDLESQAYAHRVLQEIGDLGCADEFREVQDFLSKFLVKPKARISFHDVLTKWMFRTHISRQKALNAIVGFGQPIIPMLVEFFRRLASLEKVDGYYLPGNLQVTLCEALGRLGGQLCAVAFFLYVRELPHFDSTAMSVALQTLGILLPDGFNLEEAYELATGRSLKSDEDEKMRSREQWASGERVEARRVNERLQAEIQRLRQEVEEMKRRAKGRTGSSLKH